MKLIPFLFLFIACTAPDANISTDLIAYAADSSDLRVAKLNVIGRASTQTLSVDMQYINPLNEPLLFQDILIETREGSRASAVRLAVPDSIIQMADTFKVSALFAPVHSRRLFHVANVRGDLDKRYVIHFSARTMDGTLVSDEFTVEADPGVYQATLQKYTISKSVYYHPVEFTRSFAAVSNTNDDQGGRTRYQITSNEILHEGLWLKIMTHHYHDTVSVIMRCVNQSSEELLLLPGAFRLGRYEPSSDTTEYLLRAGGRHQIEMKFAAPSTNEHTLILDGILKAGGGNKQRFFSGDLRLTAVSPDVMH